MDTDTPKEVVEGTEGQVPQTENTVDITAIAKAAGWRDEGPLSAEDFLKTMPDRFNAKGKEIRELKKTVDEVARHVKTATEAAYQKGIRAAEERMAEAKANGDVDAWEAARTERDGIKSQMADAPQIAPEVTVWMEVNPWFDKDKAMTADALDYKERFIKANPHATIGDVLEYVESKIKRDYPDKFKTKSSDDDTPPQKSHASAVEGVKGGGVGKDPLAKLEASLTPEEKRVMAQYVDRGIMTKKDYLEQIQMIQDNGGRAVATFTQGKGARA